MHSKHVQSLRRLTEFMSATETYPKRLHGMKERRYLRSFRRSHYVSRKSHFLFRNATWRKETSSFNYAARVEQLLCACCVCCCTVQSADCLVERSSALFIQTRGKTPLHWGVEVALLRNRTIHRQNHPPSAGGFHIRCKPAERWFETAGIYNLSIHTAYSASPAERRYKYINLRLDNNRRHACAYRGRRSAHARSQVLPGTPV